MGRFLSRDPIGYAGGASAYAYIEASPVSFADPMGLCKKCRVEIEGGTTTSASPPQPFVYDEQHYYDESGHGDFIREGYITRKGQLCGAYRAWTNPNDLSVAFFEAYASSRVYRVKDERTWQAPNVWTQTVTTILKAKAGPVRAKVTCVWNQRRRRCEVVGKSGGAEVNTRRWGWGFWSVDVSAGAFAKIAHVASDGNSADIAVGFASAFGAKVQFTGSANAGYGSLTITATSSESHKFADDTVYTVTCHPEEE